MLQPKLLLIEIPGAVVTFFGLLAIWTQAVPSVAPPAVSGDQSPLALPFVVSNSTSLMTFSGVTTSCAFDEMKWDVDNPYMISGMIQSYPAPGGTLAPGGSVMVDCLAVQSLHDFSKYHMTGNLTSMRAQITVNYRFLFLPRSFKSVHFCWQTTPPSGHQWSVCERLKSDSET